MGGNSLPGPSLGIGGSSKGSTGRTSSPNRAGSSSKDNKAGSSNSRVKQLEEYGNDKGTAQYLADQAEMNASRTTAQGTGNASNKLIKSADDVVFNQKSIDKAFGKHSGDFGKYPDGKSASVGQFKNDLKDFIETNTQKSGTYYGNQGTHIYNESTQQWVFVNSDSTFNTAFKLSPDQFKYLIETGVVR